MPKHILVATVLFVALFSASPAPAANLSIEYENRTPFELIEIKSDLETSREERKTGSRVCLINGGTYRIGVNGAIKPLRIRAEFAEGRLEFNDLSGLEMRENMKLAIVYDDKGARLEQEGPDGPREVEGTVTWVVTPENRGSAVTRETVVAAGNLDEVRALLGKAGAATGGGEERKTFDVEAGPIWNNDHARERCPEVLAEWNNAQPEGAPKATWTGNWVTTVSGEMSVCNFAVGSAPSDPSRIMEDDGLLYFPVTWVGKTGTGIAQSMGGHGDGVAVVLRLAADDKTLEAAFADLAQQGLRPWAAELEMRTMEDSREMRYAESGKDAAADRADLLAAILAARESNSLRDTQCLLITEAAFAEGKAGKDISPAPGMVLRVGPGTLEAIFVPDCSTIMP